MELLQLVMSHCFAPFWSFLTSQRVLFSCAFRLRPFWHERAQKLEPSASNRREKRSAVTRAESSELKNHQV